jgi:hypothetical protein
MFSQLLPLISKADFHKAVHETRAERHARGFSSWSQFVAMLFCQLAQAQSLREICTGLASCEGRLQHLGVEGAPKRATLSYANRHRPWQMYEKLYYLTLERLYGEGSGRAQRRLRLKHKLLSIDASVIDLCLTVFDWAKFRRRKGAIKLHMVLDHDGCLPAYAVVTTGSQHEVKVARGLHFEPGTVVIFDRGYVDYAWWGQLCAGGVIFVTRLKSNATYEVLEERAVPRQRNVISDQVIRLSGQAASGCPDPLRRVEVRVPDSDKTMVFVTNHLKWGATTVAAIYKERWQVELFFKALKQNLKIKSFLGTNANAVQTQVWTALLVMLLLKYMQLKARYKWSLSNLVALLRMNLFVYRDLWAWLDRPSSAPPVPQAVQPSLSFG